MADVYGNNESTAAEAHSGEGAGAQPAPAGGEQSAQAVWRAGQLAPAMNMNPPVEHFAHDGDRVVEIDIRKYGNPHASVDYYRDCDVDDEESSAEVE